MQQSSSGRLRPGRRPRSALVRLAAVLAAVGLAAAACGDDDDDSGAPATTAGGATTVAEGSTTTAGPQRGGKLTYLHFTESRGLDPIMATNASRAGDTPQMNAIYDSLIYEDQATAELKMQIAESMTTTDARVWTLKIKPNVKFSDGTPYDAEAVRFNWQRIMDTPTAVVRVGLAGVESMEVVDPLTLRITLNQPNSQFSRLVAKNVPYIASPTAIQAKGDRFSSEPVGAGPFVVREWVRDSRLELARNPTYWQAGKPYLDEVSIRYIPDHEARLNTLLTGAAQIAESGPNPPIADRAEKAGFKLLEARPSAGIAVVFNLRKPPFDDVRIRRAVALALNLPEHNQVVYEGLNEVPRTFFIETNPNHDPSLVLTGAEPNQAEAQRLFDEYAAEKGAPAEFVMTPTQTLARNFEYFQAQLSRYRNVRATLETPIQTTQLQPRLSRGDFQMSTYAMLSPDPANDVINQFRTGSSLNFWGYSNPEMDAALDTLRSSLDRARVAEAWKTVQRRLIADVPHVYIQRFQQWDMYDESVQGLSHTNVGPMWADIWLKK